MFQMLAVDRPDVLDPAQLVRIEAVHRGFLYQHLYAVRCLLLAPGSDVLSIIVESDEDIELVRSDRREYIQVKSRLDALGNGDVDDALVRFEAYRALHRDGGRTGACHFVIVTNARLAPSLEVRLASPAWPSDVRIDRPEGPVPVDAVTPPPPADVGAATDACQILAAALPFSMVAPGTLVWKLAGEVMAAAAGERGRSDHSFAPGELPALFEQLVIQLQDFPAPPPVYRPQSGEPDLRTDARVRLVTGWSGAGKTSWVAQAVVHVPNEAVYLDVRDMPGSSLASALTREIGARLYGSGGQLGRMLLPGASGTEGLRMLDRRLGGEARPVLVVLDNVHAVPPEDVTRVIATTAVLRFVLLAHPGVTSAQLASRLGVSAETLRGWDPETIAAEVSAGGCRAAPATCDKLLALTGGLPFYVQSAITTSFRRHAGDVGALCDELGSRTHSVETAQELILRGTVENLAPGTRRTLGLLSVSDVPLARGDLIAALRSAFDTDPVSASMEMRHLHTIGVLEVFGADRVKVHDALRLTGRTELDALGSDTTLRVLRSLREVLQYSIQADWSHAKVRLLLRLIGETGDARTLVQLAGDEIFHEMGFWPEISSRLRACADDVSLDPETRFLALDGLVFALTRDGRPEAAVRLRQMRALADASELSDAAMLSLIIKEMAHFAIEGDREAASRALHDARLRLPDDGAFRRILDYNASVASFQLGDFEVSAMGAMNVANEYFRLLGVNPDDVFGSSAEDLHSLISNHDDLNDNCKHLADCLVLYAMSAQGLGRSTPLARIQALKFYQLAQAPESLIRVGQDAVDEFVRMGDFTGALQLCEDAVLPIVRDLNLADHVVPVRAQHAVLLAYCDQGERARTEMERLRVYEGALDVDARTELDRQRSIVERLRKDGPPLQWFEAGKNGSRSQEDLVIRRNGPCPCGSGSRFKRCCGRLTDE